MIQTDTPHWMATLYNNKISLNVICNKNKYIPGLLATCTRQNMGFHTLFIIRFRRPSVLKDYRILKEVIKLHALKAYL